MADNLPPPPPRNVANNELTLSGYMNNDLLKYKLVCDTLGIALWDMDFVTDSVKRDGRLEWSQKMRELLGFEDEHDFPNVIDSWSNRLHPEDRGRVLDALDVHLEDITGHTPYDVEYRLMLKNGQYRHFRDVGATLRNIKGVPLKIVGTLQDITEKIEASKKIRESNEHSKRREKLTDSLNEAAVIFLARAEETFEQNMTNGVKPIAGAVGIHRLSVWQNSMSQEGLHCNQIYRWYEDSGGTTESMPEYQNVSFARIAPRWESVLSKGEIISGPTVTMPEAALFKVPGTKSVLIAPVFINNAFWGFAMFEDLRNERFFDDDAIDMLRSATFLLANTLIYVEMKHQLSSQKENIQWLEIEARKIYFDPLTGIYNRRYLDENLERVIKSLSRSGTMFSLMMIDIDCFKLYNDTYGHGLGDVCLKIIAETIAKSLPRTDDFVARYGGEEFIVVLPNTDENGAKFIANKLLENVRKCNIEHKRNLASSYVTVSIGVATGAIDFSQTGKLYIKHADKMLYASKLNGRNRCTFALLKDIPSHPSLSAENIALIESANQALDVTERRSALVGALNDAIGIFSAHSEMTFDEVMTNGLRPLADAMRVNRITICRGAEVDGKHLFKQIHRWDKNKGGLTLQDRPFLPDNEIIQNWTGILRQNRCINLQTSNMTKAEVDFMNIFNLKSVLMTPVFTHGELWGAVIFMDTKNERLFDEDCMDLFQSGALICVNAIIRAEMAQSAEKAFEAYKSELNKSLDTLSSILNGINAMIYVTNPSNDEILFINDHMKHHYGIVGGVGDVCYKVLQEGIEERCSFCPCRQLDSEPDKTVVWEEHSTLTKKYYRNTDRYIDWPGGMKVHIQHSVDITDIKQAIEHLERHDVLTTSLNKAAAKFLSNSEEKFEEIMTEGIKPIAYAAGFNRVTLWRSSKVKEASHVTLIFRWSFEEGGTTEPEQKLTEAMNTYLMPSWKEFLLGGGMLNSPTSLLPESEILKSFDIKSAFVAPVFDAGAFWGFAFFADHSSERYFDDDCVEILQSATFLLANAVMQAEMVREIVSQSELNEAMFDSAPIGLAMFDENFNFIDCNEALLEMYGVTKQYFINDFYSLLPEFQPDGSRSREKLHKLISRVLNGERMRVEWMHCTPDGKPFPVEVTLTRTKQGEKYIGLGYVHDLRSIRNAEKSLV